MILEREEDIFDGFNITLLMLLVIWLKAKVAEVMVFVITIWIVVTTMPV